MRRLCYSTALRRFVRKRGENTLRHTHATLLISQRIPVKTIADLLGNTQQMIYMFMAIHSKNLKKNLYKLLET